MTTLLPDLSTLEPAEARILMRARERAKEIVNDHAPRTIEEGRAQPISPLATIKTEALAHLIALTNLHKAGAQHHARNGNERQEAIWERDAESLAAMAAALFLVEMG